MTKRKKPVDVLAMGKFYVAIRELPYHEQKAALTWLSRRIDADERKRQESVASLTASKEPK